MSISLEIEALKGRSPRARNTILSHISIDQFNDIQLNESKNIHWKNSIHYHKISKYTSI